MLKISKYILLLALLILISYGCYLAIQNLITMFSSLDKEISVGIITGATTLVVAIITIMLGRYYERKKEIEAQFRTKKIEIYDEFLKNFLNYLIKMNALQVKLKW